MRGAAAVAPLALAFAILIAPTAAPGAPPDLPGHTSSAPVAGAAAGNGPLSGPKLKRKLRKLIAGAGGSSGAWASDTEGGFLFKRAASKQRKLASNMKLFTTATALVRFGASRRLATSAWRVGPLSDGVLHGYLVLRGGGDPALDSKHLGKLAGRVHAAGIERVTGKLVFDESIFDSRRSVPEAGISAESVGTLSGLQYDLGRAGDPARKASKRFVRALHKHGVSIPRKTKRGRLGAAKAGHKKLASVYSPAMADLIAATNVHSNNYMAEMLLKDVGAYFGKTGSTSQGLKRVRGFAHKRGASVHAQNGSGLSVRDRAAPISVGRLLLSMDGEPAAIADAFFDSLAIAGHTGTLFDRMRGTAADGRCHAKTGTLSGVSALSGYCQARTGRLLAFSILMNGVDIGHAHVLQDKMAAAIARYKP